ncbi:type II secretion system F family protein [Rubellimicrobium aerolatum]|uniref:Type II secretion system F family protein n=1 Tax=Rubellimicrobium aerolatum TaxID=490979 RepID=A0ABW0SCP6_9RHOB|nr:type II secretion system F family protein [Rubellimicrobium aerolatum]MBP1806169.1 general secretion pathway protein F [Rubellimicrobium aerolatum]
MPIFAYRAYTEAGRVETGEIEAPSEQAAFRTLSATGLSVVDLGESRHAIRVPWYRRDIPLFGTRMTLAAQAALAEEMATMLRVRLPVLDMLHLLSEGAEGADTRARLSRVARLVAEGTALPDAFAQAGPRVAPVFLALLRAGEASTALAEQLAELARLLRRQDQLRSQVAGALIYPALLIAAALAVVLIVALTLAPALAPIFTAQDRPPPAAVATFLAIGDLVTTRWPWLLAGLVGAGFVAYMGFRAIGARLMLALPVVGDLARDAALLTLLRSLALLLRAGRPLAGSLRAVAEFDRGAPFAATALAAATELENGGRAHAALAADRRLPAMARELFRIGEEANTLVPVLESLAETQADRLDRRSRRLLQLLTPVLTLVIGGIVGTLVYSIMDAVFAINDLAL